MRLSIKMRRLREGRGLSQAALARRAKVGRTTLIRIEQGAQNPTLGTLERIAMALRVKVHDLLLG